MEIDQIAFDQLDAKKYILVKAASLHNLKEIDVAFQRNKLIVVTGLSGSGKSSLAFDTLYKEGQRRYVESLSAYARQFLGRFSKPKVEYIKGIAPAIAIEQKVNTSNPRSTVGTVTEIYDYLKLLYARIGQTFDPDTGQRVQKDTVSTVVDYIKSLDLGTKLLLTIDFKLSKQRSLLESLKLFLEQGYARVLYKGKVERIDKILSIESLDIASITHLVIDRLVIKSYEDQDFYNRLADSIDIAFYEGKGSCNIVLLDQLNDYKFFSNRFAIGDKEFVEPSVDMFTFNSPYGACLKCEGFGQEIGIDPHLVIPNPDKSIYEGAVSPWNTTKAVGFLHSFIKRSAKFDFPIHKPYHQLAQKYKDLLWHGNKQIEGIDAFFSMLASQKHKIQNRVLISRYRGKTQCSVCKGKRLRKDASYVKISDTAITDLIDLPIDELKLFFDNLLLSAHDQLIAQRILKEINSRLDFMIKVGLSYLTLNRRSSTLSGGESQRMNLVTSLGSSLVGSMYILDEPSIGLHPKDNERLIAILKSLQQLGNTVIVVEHDEDIMKNAHQIIDIGPKAGYQGGELVYSGDFQGLLDCKTSLTAQYLSNERSIIVPKQRRSVVHLLKFKGVKIHNIKNIDIDIPLGVITTITGVSGSGKTTLIKQVVYPSLKRHLEAYPFDTSKCSSMEGDYELIDAIEFIDQNPIGKSSRSNPVTYIKAYDDIRSLFAKQSLSKARAYLPKHFSFNVEAGRCEHCKGEGVVTVSMQFMADVHLPCEYCNGKRFQSAILEVLYEGKNIADILEMTIDQALSFFTKHGELQIVKKIKPLQEVGLGYVQLGQSASTLSGGEAQRIKLASFLGKSLRQSKTLFIFDEPSTGLHFYDVEKLLVSLNALVNKGHSVILIEHHLDIIKASDYIIDLGPDGGKNGGNIVVVGTPEDVALCEASYTGQHLKDKL